jgi:hypothetical protein
MITGGGSRAANIPPKTSAFRMRSLELASAEGMVKVEIKARTKIISANFFHIRDPSFRIFLFVFYFFRRRVKKIYSIRIGEERTGSSKRIQKKSRVTLLLLGRLQTLSVRTESKMPPSINPEQPRVLTGEGRGVGRNVPRQSGIAAVKGHNMNEVLPPFLWVLSLSLPFSPLNLKRELTKVTRGAITARQKSEAP